jgi:hypothetical protein
LGELRTPPSGKWPLYEDGQPDEVFEGTAEFLNVRFDVRQNCAPLRRCIANKATSLFAGWIIIISGRRISTKVDKSLCSGNDRTLSPRHQPVALEFLVGHEFHSLLLPPKKCA